MKAENAGMSPERVQKITGWMETKGLIRKTGELIKGSSGELEPEYVSTSPGEEKAARSKPLLPGSGKGRSIPLSSKEIQEITDWLEAKGWIRKTGQLMEGPNGELEPDYVSTPLGEEKAARSRNVVPSARREDLN